MTGIAERLGRIRSRIEAACLRVERPPREVTLVAVSKTFAASAVREAWESGQEDFGESRQQEGCGKVAVLPDGLRWHFIGRLQRNKARKVVADFAVLHSIDSLRLAAHVDRIAGEMGRRPAIFLEVDFAGEESKGGFSPAEFEAALPEILKLEHVSVAGLMVIPPAAEDPEASRPWFRRARELRDGCLPGGGLSMGMSHDFEVAIEEGATVIRVGSAIFGERGHP